MEAMKGNYNQKKREINIKRKSANPLEHPRKSEDVNKM